MQCKKCKKEHPVESFQSQRIKSKLCKMCSSCRAKADIRFQRYVSKDPAAYRKTQKDWLKTENGKRYTERESDSRKTDSGREYHRIAQAKRRSTPEYNQYLTSDAYKESKRREYDKMMSDPAAKALHYIQVALCDTLRGKRDSSQRLLSSTEFAGFADLKQHFEEQFENGMSWDNHSHHGWNIGHRIAKAHFDTSIDEDVRRCWKKANLFPQWATGSGGNCSLKTKFPPKEELLQLKDCWPSSWNDTLPSDETLKALGQKCNKKSN